MSNRWTLCVCDNKNLAVILMQKNCYPDAKMSCDLLLKGLTFFFMLFQQFVELIQLRMDNFYPHSVILFNEFLLRVGNDLEI